jgi:hypothetical protein
VYDQTVRVTPLLYGLLYVLWCAAYVFTFRLFAGRSPAPQAVPFTVAFLGLTAALAWVLSGELRRFGLVPSGQISTRQRQAFQASWLIWIVVALATPVVFQPETPVYAEFLWVLAATAAFYGVNLLIRRFVR